MGYTRLSSELVSVFNPDIRDISISGTGIHIINSDFISDVTAENIFSENDYSIRENRTFTYPVFIPSDSGSKKAILLFHGLNERSWNKYLTWAYYLAAETGSYVILFPISFHINRSPVSWKDPRTMLRFLDEKIKTRGEVRNSCFANIALSNRLSDDPRRFLKSGYQTVCDVTKLMHQIAEGVHPVVPGKSRVNIFAYSIGAFLAEIIMMANPEKLFTDSKLFMFCGGSVFSNMQGESRLIMDKLAYDKVYNYYMEDFEKEIVNKGNILSHLAHGNLGMVFRSMIDFNRHGDVREKALKRIRDQIYSIGLSKDSVIPAAGISKTLNPVKGRKNCRMEILDFPFLYSHENPFPVSNNGFISEVDRCFERVFARAGLFLA